MAMLAFLNVSVVPECQMGARDVMMFVQKWTGKAGETTTEHIPLKKDDK